MPPCLSIWSWIPVEFKVTICHIMGVKNMLQKNIRYGRAWRRNPHTGLENLTLYIMYFVE
jgi:hypothetical protein